MYVHITCMRTCGFCCLKQVVALVLCIFCSCSQTWNSHSNSGRRHGYHRRSQYSFPMATRRGPILWSHVLLRTCCPAVVTAMLCRFRMCFIFDGVVCRMLPQARLLGRFPRKSIGTYGWMHVCMRARVGCGETKPCHAVDSWPCIPVVFSPQNHFNCHKTVTLLYSWATEMGPHRFPFA